MSAATNRDIPMELLWKCTICGNLTKRDDDLPKHCPCCGASKENFVLVEED